MYVIFYFHLTSNLDNIFFFFFKMWETILRYWVSHCNSKVIEMLAQTWQKDLVFFISNNLILEQLVSWCITNNYSRASFVYVL